MEVYDVIYSYFNKVDRAIKCSTDGKQAIVGIKNAGTWIHTSLGSQKPIKVICSFMLDGQTLYMHNAYIFMWTKNNSHSFNVKYDELYVKDGVLESRYKDLTPNDVHITIDNVESTYSITDFILLEGFLCPMHENKS